MIKEIKNLAFILLILLFIFFTVRYYFSETNKKNSFRSLVNNEKKVNLYAKKLPIIENDTKNIIEYVEKNNKKKRKKFKFLELLKSNE